MTQEQNMQEQLKNTKKFFLIKVYFEEGFKKQM